MKLPGFLRRKSRTSHPAKAEAHAKRPVDTLREPAGSSDVLTGKPDTERAEPMTRQIGQVLGIDFGTSNSCIAVIEHGRAVIIPNAEGARITPSVVAITAGGHWLVGEPAKRQAVTNPKNTVFSVKRLIGRKYDEVSQEAKWLPYKVVNAQNGDANVKIDDRVYSPLELAAVILRKLKIDAEAYLGGELTQAVITVPSYFSDSQRQATKDAARIAGLEALRIINESTAACMACGLEKKRDEIAAVVHFGGGTFDVSILDLWDGVFEVVSTAGDTHLGGDDIDWKVVEWLVAKFKEQHRIDLTTDPMALQRLKEAAGAAKCELSAAHQAEISLPFIDADRSGPKHLNATLSRQELENLAGPLIERLSGPVSAALKDAGWHLQQHCHYGNFDHVVLAGAMTRMPKVQKVIKDLFGREPCRGVHPEEVVAVGAAIQGGVLAGEVKGVLLLDVTPFSLGIETLGQGFTKLIERNTSIPTKKSQIFSTAADNQPAVSVHVLQGERFLVTDLGMKSLGRFDLVGIPPAPKGMPQIEVTFDIDANGILSVSAKDLGTGGREQRITITAYSGLTEKEISKAAKESEIFSQQYRTRYQPVVAASEERGRS